MEEGNFRTVPTFTTHRVVGGGVQLFKTASGDAIGVAGKEAIERHAYYDIDEAQTDGNPPDCGAAATDSEMGYDSVQAWPDPVAPEDYPSASVT